MILKISLKSKLQSLTLNQQDLTKSPEEYLMTKPPWLDFPQWKAGFQLPRTDDHFFIALFFEVILKVLLYCIKVNIKLQNQIYCKMDN